MTNFTSKGLNISQYPLPEIFTFKTHEEIYQTSVQTFVALSPEYNALFETDPAIILLEADAAREVVFRQEINDYGKGLFLSYAKDTALDEIADTYYQNVERILITEQDNTRNPPIPAVWESDDEFRERIQLSPESHTTAGTKGSYEFWGKSASSLVKDINATTPKRVLDTREEIWDSIKLKISDGITNQTGTEFDESETQLLNELFHSQGHVHVTVLSNEQDDGTPSANLLAIVKAELNQDNRVPLTDWIHIAAPNQTYYYELIINFWAYEGPDPLVIKQAIVERAKEYTELHHAIGHDIEKSAILASFQGVGIKKIDIPSIPETILVNYNEVAYCTNVEVNYMGTDE